MSLSVEELDAVVRDLAPRLRGARIERIDQPERHAIVLSLRQRGARYWLLMSAHPRFSRLHLVFGRPEQRPPAGFCNVLRQHLTGAPIEELSQLEGDRVVIIRSIERDSLMAPHRVSLVAELMGPASNLILLDENDTILGVLFRRTIAGRRLAPGEQYVLPQAVTGRRGRAHGNRFLPANGVAEPLALNRAIHEHYARLEGEERLESARAELRRALRSAIKRSRRRIESLHGDLEQAGKADLLRRHGELLKIALPDLRPGQSHVVVRDLFEGGEPELTIQLDPALSPEQNVERLFRRYKKAAAARPRLEGLLQEQEKALEALEGLARDLAAARSIEAIAGLRERAAELGIRSGGTPPGAPAARPVARGPRSFRSADGLEILVARNERENERLTFSIARGNDYWVHLKDWPGPHVIVRTPRDGQLPGETLLDAGHLAMHFSRIRGARGADVVYTQRKNVRRAGKAGPGRVNYSAARTIRIRFDEARIRRLLERTDGS